MKCPRCRNLPNYGPGDSFVCPCGHRFRRSLYSYCTFTAPGRRMSADEVASLRRLKAVR